MTREFPTIGGITVGVHEVATDQPEVDRILAWSSTPVAVVRTTTLKPDAARYRTA